MHLSEIIKTIKERRETLQVKEGLAELSGFGLI
jgi:hypothetical protein